MAHYPPTCREPPNETRHHHRNGGLLVHSWAVVHGRAGAVLRADRAGRGDHPMSRRHEPVRHARSSRNLRKVLHHAENAVEEAKYLSAELSEAADRLVKLSLKIRNRMRAEAAE